MAHVKKDPVTILAEEIGELIDCFEDGIVPGVAGPTQFIIPSTSGTIDPFTEEVTFHKPDILFNASGVIGTVVENDKLLGVKGQIQVGDMMISYSYNHVSGALPFAIDQIKLLAPAVSGLYHIEGSWIDVVANTPVFVHFGLKPDQNG